VTDNYAHQGRDNEKGHVCRTNAMKATCLQGSISLRTVQRWLMLAVLVSGVRTGFGAGPAKFEPADGVVYHGAFPVGQDDITYWLDPFTFEDLASKDLAIVLWYGDWSLSFQDGYDSIINQYLKPYGPVLEAGWMPSGVPLDDINNGLWDAYLHQWFAEARDNGEPIFLRFANEMNGNWLSWDGWHNGGSTSTELGWAATEKYKAMWRRVYTIAREEQACNVAFVWAPNYASCPDPSDPQYAWNHWSNYYPGDAYVDWVGIDLYDFSGQNPADDIQPFYDEYATRKPILLAETAGHYDPSVNADKERYIGQLFDALENLYPQIKGFVWFNHHEPGYNWRIEETPESLAAYQLRVADPRYVGAVDRVDTDLDGVPDYCDNCPDLANPDQADAITALKWLISISRTPTATEWAMYAIQT